MLKLSVQPLLGREDDLYHVGHLISNYLNPLNGFIDPPESDQEIEELAQFYKKLILTNLGLQSTDNAALADFIENFQMLYPRLYSAVVGDGGEAFYWANLSDRINGFKNYPFY